MNNHYNTAVYEVGKAGAMLEAVELLCSDLDLLPEDLAKLNAAAYLFYAAVDAVKKAGEELNEYSAECHIVDVIQTAREAHGI